MTKLVGIFNNFFSGDSDNPHRAREKSGDNLNIFQVIDKFKTHPSIIKIKENVNNKIKFSFALSSHDELKKCTNRLNTAKPATYNKIPAKSLFIYFIYFSLFIVGINTTSKKHIKINCIEKYLVNICIRYKRATKSCLINYVNKPDTINICFA